MGLSDAEAERLRPEELSILRAGIDLGVKSIATGVFHKELFEAAREHSEYMARVNKQGHQNWDARFRKLMDIMGGRLPTEICAETWGWEATLDEVGREFFKSWSQSPGHWRAANGECDYYGYSCCKGRKVYYACGIVVKKQDRDQEYGAIERENDGDPS